MSDLQQEEEDAELGDVAYLLDLAERVLHIPVMYGTDSCDYSRLREIAHRIEGLEK